MNHRGTETQSASGLSPALRWYRRQASENTMRGLTVKGTERKRRPNAGSRQMQILMRRERGLTAWDRRVNRLRSLGLTTRGTPRVYAVRRGDALLLRAQVDALASALGRCFHDLPAAAQTRILDLESHLSAVRKQIL